MSKNHPKSPFQSQSSTVQSGLDSLLANEISRRSVANTLWAWRNQKVNAKALVFGLLEKFHEISDRQKNILVDASVIATEENEQPYHGNEHYVDVTSGTIMLGNRALQEGRLTIDTFVCMVTAALIHDYKHDGKGNMGEQFRLEQLAFDSAKSKLKNAGASDGELEIIEAFVLNTDVSKDFGDPDALSASDTVKLYIDSGFQNEELLHPRLQILAKKDLADAAQMLQDSDVGTAMADPAYSDYQGLLIAHETGSVDKKSRTYDRSSQLDFFIPKIMHGGKVYSESGRQIIQEWIPDVIKYQQRKLSTNDNKKGMHP